LAGLFLVLQIITGILLAMQYTPHADLAFDSVERVMRDINFG
jgi:quinol-cytochrome oxidoreductase complex cytochrome b subunit